MVFEQNFDICKLQKLNVKIASVFENFKSSISFKVEFPFLKGYYKVNKFQFPVFSIPSFIKTNDRFSTVLKFNTRIGSKMVNF